MGFINFILPYVVAGASLSIAAALFIKTIGVKKSGVKWLIANIATAAPTILHAFVTYGATDKRVIAMQVGLVGFFSSSTYVLVIKPVMAKLFKDIDDFIDYRTNVKSAAAPVVEPVVPLV